MPQFAIRSTGKSGITDVLLKEYEKYVQSIDDHTMGILQFRETEDIALAREALRLAGKKLGLDLIVLRPRGRKVLQFRLNKKRVTRPLRNRTIRVWSLSRAETDRIFDGSQSVVAEWLKHGLLTEASTELDAATDLLCHYLKPDRIPTVVRKSIPALGDVSLLKMLKQGDTKTLIATCRDMFRFDQVHS